MGDLTDVEILEISKLVTKTRDLGLYLGLEEARVSACIDEDNRDRTKKDGTYAMLKEWNADTGTKDKLVTGLRQAGMGKLADRVQAGILKTDSVSGSAPVESTSNAPPSQRSGGQQAASGGDEKPLDTATLRKIGQELTIGKEELAEELGMKWKNYEETNYRGRTVTSEGTVQMLKDWREGVKPADQRAELRKALRAAGLIRIQEEFLP